MALATFLGINETKDLIKASFKHFIQVGPGGYFPLCLWGEKGIGKTASAKQAVTELEKELDVSIKLTILKLSAMQPFTINGYPQIVTKEINGVKMDVQQHAVPKFLVEGSSHDYHFVFVDEINRARPEMHNAIMGMLDGDGVNEHEIPKNMFLLAAANPSNENYANVIDTDDEAFLDRMYHINVATKKDETLSYMVGDKSIDPVVLNFLNEDHKRIQVKHEFTPTSAGIKDPSDRAYSVVGRFLPYLPKFSEIREAAIKGMIGDDTGTLFIDRLHKYEGILSPEEILNKLDTNMKATLKEYSNPTEDGITRLDTLGRLNDVLILFLNNDGRKDLTKKQLGNIKDYAGIIPHDLAEHFFTKTNLNDKELKFFGKEIKEVMAEETVSLDDLDFR